MKIKWFYWWIRMEINDNIFLLQNSVLSEMELHQSISVIFIVSTVYIYSEQKIKEIYLIKFINQEFCEVVFSKTKKWKIIKCFHDAKWIKHPFEIYVSFETLLQKIDGCENNPKKIFYCWCKQTETLWFSNSN